MDKLTIAISVFLFLSILVLIRTALRQSRLEKELGDYRAQAELAAEAQTAQFERRKEKLLEEIKNNKDVEQRLRGYLDILDKLIHSIPNPIYFKDDKGVFRGCNRAFAEDFLGLSRESIIGSTHRDFVDIISEDLAEHYHREDVLLLAGKGDSRFETRVLVADGQARDFLVSRAVYEQKEDGAKGIVGVMLDLTEKNKIAEKQLQNEKLQGVLEIAGAVCHELNQPMMAISGYAELLLLDKPEDDSQRQNLVRICEQVDRMAGITRKLLGITRYKTKDYAGGSKIIDIDKSARDPSGADD